MSLTIKDLELILDVAQGRKTDLQSINQALYSMGLIKNVNSKNVKWGPRSLRRAELILKLNWPLTSLLLVLNTITKIRDINASTQNSKNESNQTIQSIQSEGSKLNLSGRSPLGQWLASGYEEGLKKLAENALKDYELRLKDKDWLAGKNSFEADRNKTKHAIFRPGSVTTFLNNMILAPIQRAVNEVNPEAGSIGGEFYNLSSRAENALKQALQFKLSDVVKDKKFAKYTKKGDTPEQILAKYFAQNPDAEINTAWVGRGAGKRLVNKNSDYARFFGKENSYNELTSGSKREEALTTNGLADLANTLGSFAIRITKDGVLVNDVYDFHSDKGLESDLISDLSEVGLMESIRRFADRHGTREASHPLANGTNETPTTRFKITYNYDDLNDILLDTPLLMSAFATSPVYKFGGKLTRRYII